MASGLAYIHRHGFVHKDIKPSNILVKDGIIKITDMGISKEFIPDQSHVSKTSVGGTMGWTAPEYEVPHKPEFAPSGDIWALGCVLHYLFTRGGHPFGLDDTWTGLKNATNFDYCNLGELQSRLGTDYDVITQLIIKMVSPVATERPSIKEVKIISEGALTLGENLKPLKKNSKNLNDGK